MSPQSPQAYAAASGTTLPQGTAERFAGYGVLGIPFSSGFYLAFRHFPASSIGPGYHAVWVRRPSGHWTVYADAPPQLSCARYFGAALSAAIPTDVTIDWNTPSAAEIRVPGVLEWRIEMAASAATTAMSALALRMPATLWHNEPVLAGMGAMAGRMLGAGKMRFSGVVPNGQTFQAQPLHVWTVPASTAVIGGVDAGRPAPLPEQDHLGDFWLPQRGLFVAGLAVRFPSTAGRPASDSPEVSRS